MASRSIPNPLITEPQRDDLQVLRRRFTIAASLLIFAGLVIVTVLLWLLPGAVETLRAGVNMRVYVVFLTALSGGLVGLSIWGNSRIAGYGLALMMVIAAVVSPPDTPAIMLLALVIAAIVIDNRRVFGLIAVLMFGKAVFDVVEYLGRAPEDAFEITRFIATRFILYVLALVVRYVIELVERTLENAQRSNTLLKTSAEIGTVTTQLTDLSSLFERVVNLVRERFGFYHVQIFIVDQSGDQAVLQASTGEVGRQLLERRHQLAVGSQSVIGQVTQRGEPVIARDTNQDAVHFRNELLLNTRSEMAVPIRDGSVIMGALDVQSVKPNAFDDIDLEALVVIADFLSTAIRNAATYQEQLRVGEQNQVLLAEAEENIRLIQRLNRQLTRSTWDEFSRGQLLISGVEAKDQLVRHDADWTHTLAAAGSENRPVVEKSEDRALVAVPLTLRGEVIGAIEVESGTENDPSTVAMLEDVASRLAISLENARLYEESRDATAQEQFINSLAARYQSATTVDELLRLTLVELSETLGAKSGSIRLGKLEMMNGDTTKTGASPR